MIPTSEQTVNVPPAFAPLRDTPESEAMKQKALKALGSLPPFSPILTRLLASLANENVSFMDLSALIEKDTVVAGNLLQLVNSALYARREKINSIGHALSVLGIAKLRNAVLGMSVTRMWKQVHTPPSWSMARFNMHSSAVAMLSDMLAQKLPVQYPEGAFVAGLLHDIGRLLIAIGLPEISEKLAARNCAAPTGATTASMYEAELELLGFDHAELSAEVLQIWKLPAPICDAVRDHHVAARCSVPAAPNSGKRDVPLACIVSAADRYVDQQGVSILEGQTPPAWNPATFVALGLPEAQQEPLLSDFEQEYRALISYFR